MNNNQQQQQQQYSSSSSTTTTTNGGNNMTMNVVNVSGPRSKCDQVIFEALCKACEVIVGSRTSNSNSNSTTTSNVTFNHHSPYSPNNNNNNSTNTTTSTRFNLQIPEIHGVRQILSQHRSQLHVPIRLDVYYQHPLTTNHNNNDNNTNNDNNNSRELLERWCFDYRCCSTMDLFLQTEGFASSSSSTTSNHNNKQDPMTQLRHVCKRIVVWLRTLYVFTRLLPASSLLLSQQQQGLRGTMNHTNNNHNIGFSLYVNHDGMDDVNFLVQQQGFLMQSVGGGSGQGGQHVTTPYGQLQAHVAYLPTSRIQHLFVLLNNNNTATTNNNTTQQAYKSSTTTTTTSRSIPMNVQQNRNHGNHFSTNINSSTSPHSTSPHNYSRQLSAPAVISGQDSDHRRAASYSERSKQLQQQASHRGGGQHHVGTYDPSTMIPPRKKVDPTIQQNNLLNTIQQQQDHHMKLLHRRHSTAIDATTTGSTSSPIHTTTTTTTTTSSISQQQDSDKPPGRVMSGLSLALMNHNNNHNHNHHTVETGTQNVDTTAVDDDNEVDDIAKKIHHEKRRAALHQIPPHLVEHHAGGQLQQVPGSPRFHPSTSREYGYAYNNHIPWQEVPPPPSHPAIPSSSSSYTGSNNNNATPLRSNSFDRAASPAPFSFIQQNQYQNQQHYLSPHTPPTAAFLGAGHTPPVGRPRSGSATGFVLSSLHGFIPPAANSSRRNSSSNNNNNNIPIITNGGHQKMDTFPFSNGVCVTPPFQNRPIGFTHEADVVTATTTTTEDTAIRAATTLNHHPTSDPYSLETGETTTTPTPTAELASLDLLHNNPFHLPIHQQTSLLSSLLPITTTGSMGPTGFFHDSSVLTNPNGTGTGTGGWSTGIGTIPQPLSGSAFANIASFRTAYGDHHHYHHHHPNDDHNNDLDYYEDTMPFAVDLTTSNTVVVPQQQNVAGMDNITTSLGQSAAGLASLAQRCSASNHRLKLFDSISTLNTNTTTINTNTLVGNDMYVQQQQQNINNHSHPYQNNNNNNPDDLVNSLADQLNEFRSFGASLHLSTNSTSIHSHHLHNIGSTTTTVTEGVQH